MAANEIEKNNYQRTFKSLQLILFKQADKRVKYHSNAVALKGQFFPKNYKNRPAFGDSTPRHLSTKRRHNLASSSSPSYQIPGYAPVNS